MHWFWRVTIAAGAAAFLWVVAVVVAMVVGAKMGVKELGLGLFIFATQPLSVVAGIAFFAMFSRSRDDEGQTRCRKCQYILRGISEPRCPDYGERI